jgi:hypothetical protein
LDTPVSCNKNFQNFQFLAHQPEDCNDRGLVPAFST